MQNISLKSLGMTDSKIFHLFFFAFLDLFVFLLQSINLIGFILVGNVFGKAFEILGLNERKGSWVAKQHLSPSQVSGQSCPWLLKLVMLQEVEGTWICTG